MVVAAALAAGVPTGLAAVILGDSTLRGFLYSAFCGACITVVGVGIWLGYRRNRYLDFMAPLVLMPGMFLVVYGLGAAAYADASYPEGEGLLRLLCLALLSYVAGVAWASTLFKPGRGLIREREQRAHDYSAASRFAMAVGVLAMLVYWGQTGGVPILAGDLENSRVAALSGSGVPFYLSMLVMPAVWLRLLSRDGRLASSDYAWCAFATLVLLSTGWRNTAVALLFVALTIRHYKRPFQARWIVTLGIGLVLIITAVGLYRVYSSQLVYYSTYQQLARGDYLGAVWTYVVTYPQVFTNNFDLVVQGFPGTMPYQNGASFFWNLQLLVPGNTAQPFDFVLKEGLRRGFSGGGLPPTLVGEMYLNFGVTGIAAGMAGVGVAYTLFHRLLTFAGSAQISRLVALVILYYLSVSVRGGLANVSITVVWLTIATLGLHFLSPIMRGGASVTAETGAANGSGVSRTAP